MTSGGGVIDVEAPGLQTTVQDVRGRPHLARYGVAAGGAADPLSAEAANLLVGNDANAPLLEITLAGPCLRFDAPTAVALAGADLEARLDGVPLAPGWSWLARAGSRLAFGGRRRGARAYLAVAGGLQVEPTLGSCATDLRAGFGGLGGRALRAGDRLRVAAVADPVTRCGWHLERDPVRDLAAPIRVLPGPHVGRFWADALDQLCAGAWRVGARADRMGYRLDGPRLHHRRAADVTSIGLPVGAIQVPGDGQPIVLLADHQPTGGYAVLACVVRADLPGVAQRVPGDEVRFARVSALEARRALLACRANLRVDRPGAEAWAAIRAAGAGPHWCRTVL